MFVIPSSLDVDHLFSALRAVLSERSGRDAPPLRWAARSTGARTGASVDLANVLSRAATRVAMTDARCGEMRSSITCLRVDPLPGRCLVALLVEIAKGMLRAPFIGRARLYVTCAWDDGALLLAVASPELAAFPALSAESARSLARASDLASALGGTLVRGVADDVMLYAATFPWRVRGGASGSHDRS